MRLTLRTMLAYLDDILEPEDAEDINKKISESDFATSLVHRTRDCVRRVRLGTPAVEGKGLAADGNTVAEYLDNTLEAERVPEFEKVCLESDVHLAEVASCHQILTLVLGEKAEVEGVNRDRMYEAITRSDKLAAEPKLAEQAKPQPVHRTPSPADTPEVNGGKRQRHEVPDYLRESAKAKRWPLAATIAIAALVTLAILLVAGPPELREQIAKWTGQGAAPADEPVAPAETSEPEAVPDDSAPPQPPSDKPTDSDPTEAPPSERLVQPQPEETDPPSDAPDAPSVPPPAPEERSIEGDPDEAAIPSPVAPGDADPVAAPDDPPSDDPAEGGSPDNPLRRDPGPLDIAQPLGAEIGRFLTDMEVAVHFDAESGNWRRLKPKAVIAAGDRVLTLPSFRPEFALTNGVSMHAAGPSSLTFEGLDENAIPVVAIEYGRLGLLTVGKAGNQVHLRLGQRDVVVTFGDAQSTLAIEVAGVLPPGADPEAGATELAVDLYATSGQIRISEGGKEQTIKAPDHVTLTALSASNMAAGQLPDWATRNVTNPLDERAATALEKELTPDQSLSLKLKELSQNRRAEVRALAIRCGGYVGDFEPYVSALMDADQRASWPAQIDSLRAAIARGPQTAALVRETLVKSRGEDGKAIYRMLWGYTAEQLKNGEAEKLVDGLDHADLDVRVLSFSNLQHITGMSLFYRPEQTAAKRKASFTKWREKLNDGKIVPQQAPPARAGNSKSEIRNPKQARNTKYKIRAASFVSR